MAVTCVSSSDLTRLPRVIAELRIGQKRVEKAPGMRFSQLSDNLGWYDELALRVDGQLFILFRYERFPSAMLSVRADVDDDNWDASVDALLAALGEKRSILGAWRPTPEAATSS